MPQPLLEMRGIVKEFPGVRALDGVDLVVRAGEVHCLLGQNGAGKSTLIKVLSGAHDVDEGTILWEGEPVTFADPQAALATGIATIYQELDLIDGLSVADNIFLGHENARGGITRDGDMNRSARELLHRLGHPEIRPTREVGSLSAAGKQIVSMARALSRNARVIVMDEPSAVLDPDEVDGLFQVVDDLRASGAAIIYISHRLEEIRRIGDRLTVLKDGKTVAIGPARPGHPDLRAHHADDRAHRCRRCSPGVRRPLPDEAPLLEVDGDRPRRRVRRRVVRRTSRRDRRDRRSGRRRSQRDHRDDLRRPPGEPRLRQRRRQARCATARSTRRSHCRPRPVP